MKSYVPRNDVILAECTCVFPKLSKKQCVKDVLILVTVPVLTGFYW